ncbi:hypothetical protein [Corynebacterium yonathiae]|uniref:Uncharacterized protein n=1 Tax=Corynebacterium yonathiae TaxID=2913504 RepID=A0A9X3RM30_9CORY|nr:hypothetical protein [Corynebacterium yonathiae]MCZ9297034.1 hypothetical protein [Corynebacterium yonathiae]
MIRPDQAGEPITVKGGMVGRDHRGRPQYAPGRVIEHCVVSPAGDQVVKGDGFTHGDISKLQVLAPPGTVVADGDTVTIRGEDYTVQQRKSFDYSVGRRPVVSWHQPKVVFIVERGEVSDGVA